jgi:hypothetical protein
MSEIVVRFAGGATPEQGGLVASIGTQHTRRCVVAGGKFAPCSCGAEELWQQFTGANGADPWAAISRWAAQTEPVGGGGNQ